MHLGKKIYVGIFMLIIATPIILGIYYGISGKKIDVELNGYFDQIDKPTVSFENIKTTELQDSFVKWMRYIREVFFINLSGVGLMLEQMNGQ